jgi:hypothetical protein
MRAWINTRSNIALYSRDWLQGGPGAAIGVVVAPSTPMLRDQDAILARVEPTLSREYGTEAVDA